ncbi:MAG: methyltransferase domain-containing protein [Bdellovibrionales bacterium]|nr:methyltransferase domain-containing protein [Bdellovibrionales bacterium]
MTPRFYYATCQFGAEKTVKDEVLRAHPSLRFAFSRPGFMTFKEESGEAPFIQNPESIFTRVWGESVGQGKGEDALQSLIPLIPKGSVLHAFERDTFVPGDEPEGFVQNARIKKLMESGGLQGFSNAPRVGEYVFDLIYLDEGHVFLGKHLHQDGMEPAPGNQPLISLPATAPSRAYLKLEEAIHRFKPECKAGTRVLEVGCAPGGASTAMLSRGFKVTGVDPKRVDPSVHQNTGFQFIQKTAKTLTRDDLKTANPEWLVLDMNLAPLEALDEIHHVLELLRSIHGSKLALNKGFLTLKLNDWKFASSIPLYLKRVSELGFRDLAAVQLCSNRQEFFVYADSFK